MMFQFITSYGQSTPALASVRVRATLIANRCFNRAGAAATVGRDGVCGVWPTLPTQPFVFSLMKFARKHLEKLRE